MIKNLFIILLVLIFMLSMISCGDTKKIGE